MKKTLSKALLVLKLFQIPDYVCGGFAVQERGYPRFTLDVDIIVPDVALAIERLSMNGFKQNPGSKMTVTDRETKLKSTFGQAERKSIRARSLTLEKLISAKLSTFMGREIERSQDHGDVVKLVQANGLARDFGVDPKVLDEYLKIWDELLQKKTSDVTDY